MAIDTVYSLVQNLQEWCSPQRPVFILDQDGNKYKAVSVQYNYEGIPYDETYSTINVELIPEEEPIS